MTEPLAARTPDGLHAPRPRCAEADPAVAFEAVVAVVDRGPTVLAPRPDGTREAWLRYACWVGVCAAHGRLPDHLTAPRRPLARLVDLLRRP